MSKELQLNYLANGDEDEQQFVRDFMNITNDRTNADDPGNAYRAIEWAIEYISNLPGVRTIQIGPDGKTDDLLINDDNQTAMYPYSIARESTAPGGKRKKVQKIKEDIHNRLRFVGPAREKILSFLQSEDYHNYTVCTSIGKLLIF